jgi:hypothetical protein
VLEYDVVGERDRRHKITGKGKEKNWFFIVGVVLLFNDLFLPAREGLILGLAELDKYNRILGEKTFRATGDFLPIKSHIFTCNLRNTLLTPHIRGNILNIPRKFKNEFFIFGFVFRLTTVNKNFIAFPKT